MKGSLSLDIVAAIIIVLILASSMLSFGYFQQEHILESTLRIRAELLAISVGSAINRFISTDPEPGSKLQITPHQINSSQPFSNILLDYSSCNYSISKGNFTVVAEIVTKTGRKEVVEARYPIFNSSLSLDSRQCGQNFTLWVKNNGEMEIE